MFSENKYQQQRPLAAETTNGIQMVKDETLPSESIDYRLDAYRSYRI
jgi:hypothetical protein